MVFFCVDISYAISFCSVYILTLSNSLFLSFFSFSLLLLLFHLVYIHSGGSFLHLALKEYLVIPIFRTYYCCLFSYTLAIYDGNSYPISTFGNTPHTCVYRATFPAFYALFLYLYSCSAGFLSVLLLSFLAALLTASR